MNPRLYSVGYALPTPQEEASFVNNVSEKKKHDHTIYTIAKRISRQQWFDLIQIQEASSLKGKIHRLTASIHSRLFVFLFQSAAKRMTRSMMASVVTVHEEIRKRERELPEGVDPKLKKALRTHLHIHYQGWPLCHVSPQASSEEAWQAILHRERERDWNRQADAWESSWQEDGLKKSVAKRILEEHKKKGEIWTPFICKELSQKLGTLLEQEPNSCGSDQQKLIDRAKQEAEKPVEIPCDTLEGRIQRDVPQELQKLVFAIFSIGDNTIIREWEKQDDGTIAVQLHKEDTVRNAEPLLKAIYPGIPTIVAKGNVILKQSLHITVDSQPPKLHFAKGSYVITGSRFHLVDILSFTPMSETRYNKQTKNSENIECFKVVIDVFINTLKPKKAICPAQEKLIKAYEAVIHQ